jgi:uncharacterized protein GlcG (DUF336 family)
MKLRILTSRAIKMALVSSFTLTLSSGAAFSLEGPDVQKILRACAATAATTPSVFRGTPSVKMWCAVLSREGKLLDEAATDTGERPGPYLNSDAWRGSIEIAIAKAYTAVSLSSNQNALTSRQVGIATRPDGCSVTPGCDPAAVGQDNGPAPLWGLGNTNLYRPLTGSDSLMPDDSNGLKHHGIVTFAGGVPVYSCGQKKLLGGVGVSGDGVDQDETVAIGAITGAGFCTTP